VSAAYNLARTIVVLAKDGSELSLAAIKLRDLLAKQLTTPREVGPAVTEGDRERAATLSAPREWYPRLVDLIHHEDLRLLMATHQLGQDVHAHSAALSSQSALGRLCPGQRVAALEAYDVARAK
jgi:hypothetical protein